MILFISPNFGTKPETKQLIEAAKTTSITTNVMLNSWNTIKEAAIYDKRCKETTAVYGEIAFCEFIAQEMSLNLYSNSLDWVCKIHKAFIKRNISVMSIEEARFLQNKTHNILDIKHLSPVENDHSFVPAVYGGKFPNTPKETQIIVQDNVEWEVKYRFLIINSKIESFCCYKIGNLFNVPSIYSTNFLAKNINSEKFVNSLINSCNTAPACIIDVGVIKNSGWAVCGTYPVWSSELYGLDPNKFLLGLFTSCQSI